MPNTAGYRAIDPSLTVGSQFGAIQLNNATPAGTICWSDAILFVGVYIALGFAFGDARRQPLFVHWVSAAR